MVLGYCIKEWACSEDLKFSYLISDKKAAPGKAQIEIFSPWEKVGICYFLATCSRKKLNYAGF
jgi:hypothetical protein